MLQKNIRKGITEVIEILKLASDDEIKKIPKNFLNFLRKNMEEEYEFKIDKNKKITEVELMKETKNILAIIAYNYWCDTPETKMNMKKILNENQKIHSA